MASNTCGIATTPYTTVIYADESLNDACIAFTIPKIILTQEPSETLELQFSATYHCDIDDTHYLNKYNLNLHFHNNLHELTHDYGYEVLCKAHLHDATDDYHHQFLFSDREIRVRESISIKRLFSMRRCRIIHLCFYIRRFNKQRNLEFEHDDYGSMLIDTGNYSDVSLVVGDRVFKAHKHVLSSKSEVFRAMFTHEMTENQDGIVRIEDVDAEVIGEMLNYIYTGRAKNLRKIPRELFEAAHRYEILGLRSRCEEYFVFNLNCQNVIAILDMASLYELGEMKKGAMSFVSNHETDMVQEASFQKFLCRDLKVNTITETLKLCVKYGLEDVKAKAFEYVKEHNRDMVRNEEFLDLFHSQPELMKEIYIYVHK